MGLKILFTASVRSRTDEFQNLAGVPVHWDDEFSLVPKQTAFGQTAANPPVQASQIVADMLQLPSPAPPAGVPGKQIPEGPMQSPRFSGPGDDAPLVELGGYWAEMVRGVAGGNPVQVSDNVRQRLVEYSEQHPGALDDLLPLLPNDPGTFARVKAIYDRNSAAESEDWQNSVKSYLQAHGAG
jgi:hypothetical protein